MLEIRVAIRKKKKKKRNVTCNVKKLRANKDSFHFFQSLYKMYSQLAYHFA